MKKVLIFSLNYYPFVGGAEVAIKEITDRLPKDEYEFHLIAYRFDSLLPRNERIGNVQLHRIGFGKRAMTVNESFNPFVYLEKILYVPFAALKVQQLNKTERFDAFWAMMSYMLFPIVLLRIFGNRTPYLLTLQEGDPFERVFERLRIRIFAPLLSYGFKHATAVQAISTFLLAWGRRMGFKGEGSVVPNAVDTKRFMEKPTDAQIQALQTRFGTTNDDIVLITTSRLVHKNAVDDVIRALPLTDSKVVFVICGIGPDEEKLKKLVTELHLEERVKFVGQIEHAELPAILHASDIFIRPSRSEGMGNSFIEAMAVGIPVIATQEGGISDFLFDEKKNPEKLATGWAVSKDAPSEIAEAIADILAYPEKVKEVTKRSRELVQKTYDWETVAQDMDSIFTCLFDSRIA